MQSEIYCVLTIREQFVGAQEHSGTNTRRETHSDQPDLYTNLPSCTNDRGQIKVFHIIAQLPVLFFQVNIFYMVTPRIIGGHGLQKREVTVKLSRANL